MLTVPIPSLYEALELIIKKFPNDLTDQAKIEIETLLDHCLEGISDDSEKFLSALFIKALRQYIGPSGIDEHIYLKKFDIPQIQLFNILIKEFPFVKFSHDLCNALIKDYLEGRSEAMVIDVGIGQGVQIMHLLQSLRGHKTLKKLCILGIEPFGDALQIAENLITSQKDLGFEVEFTGWHTFIENISYEELHEKTSRYKGNIIINESLALHHIQSLEKRNYVIGLLRRIEPSAFLLTEPNVDHYEPNFHRRFQNCYQHFFNVFQVVDKLSIATSEKNALKSFFGREIEDIIGKQNNDRFEKHEPAFRWIEKLNQAGFRLKEHPLPMYDTDIKISYTEEGFIGFTHKTETVLAVICAES